MSVRHNSELFDLKYLSLVVKMMLDKILIISAQLLFKSLKLLAVM